MNIRRVIQLATFVFGFAWAGAFQAAEPLRILFLGDQGHHRPADLAGRLIPAFRAHGIEIEYTENVEMLASDRLASFDVLFVYANIDKISVEQEEGLLNFVASGKGIVPLHCATYCFRKSDAYVALCGAQFKSHGVEEFESITIATDHPIMAGFQSFRSLGTQLLATGVCF